MLSLPYTPTLLPLVISFISLFGRLEGSAAAVSNRTIDDEFGDSVTGQKPLFLPTTRGVWDGQDCSGCRVQPDKTKAFDQTFNAATYTPEIRSTSIELNFKGTAVYVFFIVANTIGGGSITTLTECNFTMDDKHAGYYRHDPSPSKDIMYNVLVFQNENLPNTDHKLIISTSGLDYHTFTNFDYAIYTFDDSPPSPPPSAAKPSNIQAVSGKVNTTSIQSATTSGSAPRSTNGTTLGSSTVIVDHPIATTTPQDSAQDSSTPTLSPTAGPVLENPTRASGSSPGTIAGGVLGGLGLIVFVLLLLMLYRRQKLIEEARLASAPAHPVSETPNYGYNRPDTISPTAPMIRDIDGNRYAGAGVGILEGSNGIHYAASVVSRWRRNVAAYSPRSSSSLTSRGWRSVSGSSRTGGATTISRARTGGERGEKQETSANIPDPSGGGYGQQPRPPRRSQDPLSTGTERQMREVGEEMRELGVQMSRSRSGVSPTEMAQIKEQMQLMQEQIQYLESLQGSGGPGDRKRAGNV